jgi:serine/threonine protein kinase
LILKKFWKIENEIYFLCSEFISGGSLEDYLKKRWKENRKLNEKEMTEFAISGCKGMKYLEELVKFIFFSNNFFV